MKQVQRWAGLFVLLCGALLASGCTTSLVVMHVYDKLTEGDPAPCHRLNSVDRALQARCGAFVAGSLREADVAASGLPACPLALAARDPRFWPVLPELIERGARTDTCAEPPLVALARAVPCPDFAAASPSVRGAIRHLAEHDPRAVHHDTVRLLSCPGARLAGLDTVLDTWLAQGRLAPARLAFSPFDALHPSHLGSPLAALLEADGHTARAAFAAQDSHLPPGYELALREGDLAAIDWWLARLPGLADEVPALAAGQLPWRPLARVLTPGFQPDERRQARVVEHLLARGADPWKALPHDRTLTVVAWAERLKSPLAARLAAPPVVAVAPAVAPPLAVARAGAARGY